MKVERKNNFEPVLLILETQEEVNKVFALFNHSIIIDALQIPDWWEELEHFSTDNYSKHFKALNTNLGQVKE